MDTNTIRQIPDQIFFKLWNSGLGNAFCQLHTEDRSVRTIRDYTTHYFNDGIMRAALAALLLAVALASAGYLILHPDILPESGRQQAYAILIPLGFVIWSFENVIKACRFFDASLKLKRLDLAGFALESYAPAVSDLKFKSIQWGVETNLVGRVGDRWAVLNDQPVRKTEGQSRARLIFIAVPVLLLIAAPALIIFFFMMDRSADDRDEGIFRARDVYVEDNITYDKKTRTGITGMLEITYQPGKVKYRFPHENGKPVGVGQGFYESGRLKAEWPYVDGKRHGMAKNYFESGAVKNMIPYVKGKMHGMGKIYYETGELHVDIPYENGIGKGTLKEYYKSGILKESIPYDRGKKNGTAHTYRISGKLKREVVYAEDKAVSGWAYALNGNRQEIDAARLAVIEAE